MAMMYGDEPPFQKRYFSADVMSKYEPLMTAMVKVEEDEGKDDGVWQEFETHWNKYMDLSWCSSANSKKFDIVFYGMSGYSGYLMMEYLKNNTLKKGKDKFSFAFAGRSAAKVSEMRDREFMGTEYEDTPVLTATFDDVVSIIDLVKSASVIVNVGGPYMLTEGEALVDACIWCKTDYVDISQEIPWALRIKELHRYAVDAGVSIVPSATGTAYSDLGVYLLAKKIKDDFGEPLRNAVCYCRGGGSVAGIPGEVLKTRAAMTEIGDEMRKKMGDPFVLGGFIPNIDKNGVKLVDVQQGTGVCVPKARPEDRDLEMLTVSEDKKLGVWRAPYMHSFFDTRVVRRSNMLQADLGNAPYGTAFNFMEYALLPPEAVSSAKAAARSGETVGPYGSNGVPLEEQVKDLEAEGKNYPDGEGPEVEEISDSWTGFFLYAESSTGNTTKCSFVGADGYYESSRVAIETAITLVKDKAKLPYKGGVLTPSVAGGTCLVERLINSGVKFKMGDWLDAGDLSAPKIA